MVLHTRVPVPIPNGFVVKNINLYFSKWSTITGWKGISCTKKQVPRKIDALWIRLWKIAPSTHFTRLKWWEGRHFKLASVVWLE